MSVVKISTNKLAENSAPCVVWANHHQGIPGEVIDIPRLESRMLLWCRRGAGTVTVDGTLVDLPPAQFVLLPWGVRIVYRAARRNPFELGGVHLIPRHAGIWRPGAVHDPSEALAGSPDRADDPALPSGIWNGTWVNHPALYHLAEHVAMRWIRTPPDQATSYAQGALMMAELQDLSRCPDLNALPLELTRMLAAIQAHLTRIWMLSDLAHVAGCSPAWLTRLAMRHLRRSPCRQVAVMRLERACELLRSHSMAIAAVGASVGLPDGARFTKVFSAHFGISPSAWRQLRRWSE